jgi:two-component system KDP operon response regulator KdpE
MPSEHSILIIDDEKQIHRFLNVAFESHHFKCVMAETAQKGIEKIINHRPSLVVLDLGLPDLDGLEVLKKIREWSQIPIIILSAKNDEEDIVDALDCGADDYLTKPFTVGELLARIRICLRRTQQFERGDVVFENGPVEINLDTKIVKLKGVELHLTETEYHLLKIFLKNIGKILTPQQLLKEVWGPMSQNQTQYLRVYIGHLRQKIEENPARPQILLTESGVGYRMKMFQEDGFS